MKHLPAFAVALLATAAMLDCDSALAQARGPSAQEVRAEGQFVGTGYVDRTQASRRVGGWMDVPFGEEVPDVEISALGTPGVLDAATRAAKLAELETWLRRLPGRFRIDGKIEKPGTVTVGVGGGSAVLDTTLQGEVSGIADCTEIGEGVGVECIFNATWSNIDLDVAAIGGRPTDSESLKTLQPAILLLGLNMDPPGIRSMLVTDDSIAHTWAGTLAENTVTADRLTDCRDVTPQDFRCLQPFELIAEPDSEIVTIILRTPPPEWMPFTLEPLLAAGAPEVLTITLTMRRDPEAALEEPMKTKKAR